MNKECKIGEKIVINEIIYQIIGIYIEGDIKKYGLLNLDSSTVGYTSNNLEDLIETYRMCEGI